MKICKACGSKVEGLFCPECGLKIEDNNCEENIAESSSNENKTVQYDAQPQTAPPSQQTSPFIKDDSQVNSLVTKNKKKGTVFAVLSLVFGITSLVTIGAFILPEILGIVFANLSKNGEPLHGIAKAGFICSVVSIVLLSLAIILAYFG